MWSILHNWNEIFIEKNYFEHSVPAKKLQLIYVSEMSINSSSSSNSQYTHAAPLFLSISITNICYSFGKATYSSKKGILNARIPLFTSHSSLCWISYPQWILFHCSYLQFVAAFAPFQYSNTAITYIPTYLGSRWIQFLDWAQFNWIFKRKIPQINSYFLFMSLLPLRCFGCWQNGLEDGYLYSYKCFLLSKL